MASSSVRSFKLTPAWAAAVPSAAPGRWWPQPWGRLTTPRGRSVVRATATRTLAFAVSAALAGLGGGLFAHLALFVNYETFTFGTSVELLLMLAERAVLLRELLQCRLHLLELLLQCPQRGILRRVCRLGTAAGSREGKHTEYLGHLLAEMQVLPRSFQGATW